MRKYIGQIVSLSVTRGITNYYKLLAGGTTRGGGDGGREKGPREEHTACLVCQYLSVPNTPARMSLDDTIWGKGIKLFGVCPRYLFEIDVGGW